MTETIIANIATTDFEPSQVYPASAFIRATWDAEWEYRPDLCVKSIRLNASANDLNEATLWRPYGVVKQPWENEYSETYPLALNGYWLRIDVYSNAAETETAFVGKIGNDTRKVYSSRLENLSDEEIRSGQQTWVAYGAEWLLRKIQVYQTVFYESLQPFRIDWTMNFNARGRDNSFSGNRNLYGQQDGGTHRHYFGGTALWNRREMAEYLLAHFAENYDADTDTYTGPRWTLGGQVDALEARTDDVRIEDGVTLWDALRAVIDPSTGLDWFVRPVLDEDRAVTGFEVVVFSLLAEAVEIEGLSLPANPNTVRILADRNRDLVDVDLVISEDQKFSKIRVQGARAIVAKTFRGTTNLTPAWSRSLETEYLFGTGSSTADAIAHDTVRAQARFSDVWKTFLLGPGEIVQGPKTDAAGNAYAPDENDPPAQTLQRSTLDWLPFLSGFDYRTDPPTDHRADPSLVSDFQKPLAWITAPLAGKRLPLQEAGLGLKIRQEGTGVQIDTQDPAHILAYDHWSGAYDSNVEPIYDYESLVVTIATETDTRPALEYETGEEEGTTKVIQTDAQLWAVEPGTVLEIDENDQELTTGAGYRILRNDAERLRATLAGQVARYQGERTRASLTFRGLQSYAGLIGQILTVIQEGSFSNFVAAPITQVDFDFADPKTTVKTGYAL